MSVITFQNPIPKYPIFRVDLIKYKKFISRKYKIIQDSITMKRNGIITIIKNL